MENNKQEPRTQKKRPYKLIFGVETRIVIILSSLLFKVLGNILGLAPYAPNRLHMQNYLGLGLDGQQPIEYYEKEVEE
ncbi:uncharacterized protein N7511_002308 [Penicillium nucicola]|uniref:uncharacterized protein n=1 Tax=Penicillium nucicola TaxID=1850975 RepID=UPI0025456F93|nr:uncharacterized protein N7511_002308 [Penicillium nucicola]KAJ5770257.1 hypothetical protein N7511_002308 [Penicillium nucicola]